MFECLKSDAFCLLGNIYSFDVICEIIDEIFYNFDMIGEIIDEIFNNFDVKGKDN